MTAFTTDKSQFTHYASFYGVPCYWNDDTSTLAGRNAVLDNLIPFAVWLHNVYELVALPFFAVIGFESQGFPIKIHGEIE